MDLDTRSLELLHTICTSVNITSNDIIKKHDLTRNQIDYSLKKINEFLSLHNYKPIKRSRQGSFIVDNEVLEHFSLQEDMADDSTPHKNALEEDYRILVILLMIFSVDYLSLFHFTDNLGVSKNTVVSDIKKANTLLKYHRISISYSRKDGYIFEGVEEHIRCAMISVIDRLLNTYYSDVLFKTYLHITDEQVEGQRLLLRYLESKLEVQYTDEKIKNAPFFLVLLSRRIKNGHTLDSEFNVSVKDLADTQEYEDIKSVLTEMNVSLKSNELLYLSLFILSLKVTNMTATTFSLNTLMLRKRIEEFILLLEKKTLIELNDKEQLIENLFLHLKPAYYRIRYNLNTDYSITSVLKNELDSLYYLVDQSINPLEIFFETKIPSDEVYLITMFIGAHMLNDKPAASNSTMLSAVVVCPNGIITSKLLQNRLETWLPMIHFKESLSVREFYLQETSLTSQIVFSTEPLRTNLSVIVVGDDLLQMDKNRIINEVTKKIYKIDSFESLTTNILKVVKKHLVIDAETEQKIIKDLQPTYNTLFNHTDIVPEEAAKEISLSDLIKEENIQIMTDENPSWSDVLSYSTQNLIQRNIVEERYLQAMQQQYPEITPTIILGNNIVIPHSSPVNGSKKLGMSFVKVKHGFSSGEQTYRYVVTISAVDKKQHIRPMMELLKIASNPMIITQLDAAQTSEEIELIIHNSDLY